MPSRFLPPLLAFVLSVAVSASIDIHRCDTIPGEEHTIACGLNKPHSPSKGIGASRNIGDDNNPFTLYPGEEWAVTSDGIGLIGSQRNDIPGFFLHSQFKAVSRINVWHIDSHTMEPGIQTIEVFFDDGSSQVAGNPAKKGDLFTVSFEPDELLTNNAWITGNGMGAYTGNFGFSTDKKHEPVQLLSPWARQYWFNVDNSQLLGFVGNAVSDPNQCGGCYPGIYDLGFLIGKPVAEAELTDIQYDPSFFELSAGLPTSLVTTHVCNNNDIDVSKTIGYTMSTASSHCWSDSTSWNIGVSVTISGTATIPGISMTEAGVFHWGLVKSSTDDMCTSTTGSVNVNYQLQVFAHQSCDITITQWQAPIHDLKYTAFLKITYKDGSVVMRPVQKLYNGVFVSEEHIDLNCKRNVTHCPLVMKKALPVSPLRNKSGFGNKAIKVKFLSNQQQKTSRNINRSKPQQKTSRNMNRSKPQQKRSRNISPLDAAILQQQSYLAALLSRSHSRSNPPPMTLINEDPCSLTFELVEGQISNNCGIGYLERAKIQMAARFCQQVSKDAGSGPFFGDCPAADGGNVLISGFAIQKEGGGRNEYQAVAVQFEEDVQPGAGPGSCSLTFELVEFTINNVCGNGWVESNRAHIQMEFCAKIADAGGNVNSDQFTDECYSSQDSRYRVLVGEAMKFGGSMQYQVTSVEFL